MSSIRLTEPDNYDDTTVLQVGDHPCVQHWSYIKYRNTKLVSEAEVESQLNLGLYRDADDCSADLLQRLRLGMQESPSAKPYQKEFLQANS